MKQLLQRLFGKAKSIVTGSEELQFRETSQPHALVSYMHRADIKHGQLVETNLKNVRIERTNKEGQPGVTGDLTLFFCPIEKVEVLKTLSEGDYQRLPGEVKLHNFKVPTDLKPGIYNINNVMLYPNGKINVMTTQSTKMELVGH